MKAIKASVASPDLTPPEKFEVAVLITHGYGLFSAQERIDPTAYAIPEAQWGEIMGMLQTLEHTDISKVEVGMDWMNVGPSGYKP